MNQEVLDNLITEINPLVQQSIKVLEESEQQVAIQAQTFLMIKNSSERLIAECQKAKLQIKDNVLLNFLEDFMDLCRVISTKASLIKNNEDFSSIANAMLLDAFEINSKILTQIEKKDGSKPSQIDSGFLERLRWFETLFNTSYKENIDIHEGKGSQLEQNEIDRLLKKLGF